MAEIPRKIVVIGAGIAGLCAAVYASRCGYRVEVFEAHDSPGGVATSWRRGDYTFETCLHWLVGSDHNGALHAQWQEVFDIDKLNFVHPEEFVRLETEHGDSLSIYTNVGRLEAELLKRSPDDTAEIRRFTAAIRRLADLPVPGVSASWARNCLNITRLLPYLPLFWQLSSMRLEKYGNRFSDPLLKSFFGEGEMAQLSTLALVFSLAWMNEHNADYAIGGSQAIIRAIVQRLEALGGYLHCGAKVERILVEGDVAIGVMLAEGGSAKADWVISAMDGHATLYDLLGGKYVYVDKATEEIYGTMETFPSYLQVSLGVARDLSQQPGYVTHLLDEPLVVNPVPSFLRFRSVSFTMTRRLRRPGKQQSPAFSQPVILSSGLLSGNRICRGIRQRNTALPNGS